MMESQPRGAILGRRALKRRLVGARRVALLAMVLTGLAVSLGLAAAANQKEIVDALAVILCLGMVPIVVFAVVSR